jgi:hypothetical protein
MTLLLIFGRNNNDIFLSKMPIHKNEDRIRKEVNKYVFILNRYVVFI